MASVRFLLSKANAAAVPPSNQQQLQRESGPARTTATAGPSNPRTPPSQVRRTTQEEHAEADDDHRPLEDDDERPAPSYVPLSTQQMAELMMRSDLDKNKENRPLPSQTAPSAARSSAQPANPPRRNFIDKQPNAQRVSQIRDSDSDSDSSLPPPHKMTSKRSREQFEEPPQAGEDFVEIASNGDNDVSEDGGFEENPDRLPERMRNPPPNVTHIADGPRKRRRMPSHVVPRPGEERAAPPPPRQPSINVAELREREAAARRARPPVPPAEEEEAPPATYADIRETARMAQLRRPRKVQPKRVRWSEEETEGFVKLIERVGTSYSLLLKLGGESGVFEDVRDQQALRDKARNVKVEYLM